VTIHAIEEVDGQRFLVMELVQGVTLDNLIPESGPALGHILDFGMALAGAVNAAHECGVIHGDLKPSNVMIGPDERPKILDFGMAKWTEGPLEPGSDEVATRTLPTPGSIQGTVQYMSPEQIKGRSVDRRSDVFSLGVILHEMATGKRPFRGETAAELIAGILRDEPRLIAEIRSELPRQLSLIVQYALDKDPARRFQTALDLRNELEQLSSEVSSHRFGVDHNSPALDVRAVAVLPLEDLSANPNKAFFADGMTEALINTLARIGALKVISRTSVMQYKGVRKPVRETARELGVDAIVEGSVLRSGNRVRITTQLIDALRDRLIWAESYEEDLGDVLDLQSRLARSIAERIQVELTPQERAHFERSHTIDPAVHEAYMMGRHLWYQRTNESVRQGLRQFELAAQLDQTFAPAYAGIADSYIVDGGRYLGVTPKFAYDKARAAALEAVRLDEKLAEAHTSLAAVLTDYDWDWQGAEREYCRAIELNPNYATAHSWYAEQLSRMGRHDEAIAEARQAHELDPLSLVAHMIVAWILYFARRYDEAIEEARGTLERDPDYATAHRILGWAYEEIGLFDEAIASHTRAAELTDQQPNFRGQLGRAYALAGREDETRALLEELLETSEQTYVSSLD
jgi:TolB-like protein/Flp pilus assembly protein TadD